MKKIITVVLMSVLSLNAEELKETRRTLETNRWDHAVELSRAGLQRDCTFTYGLWTTVDNAHYVTNMLVTSGAYFYHEWKCSKEHLSDYPKSRVEDKGVQWQVFYDQKVTLDNEVYTNRFYKYLYPHKRIKKTVTESIIIKTNTVNEATNVVPPKKCGTCKQELR